MIRVDRNPNSTDVLDALTDVFILRDPPEHIRSGNGPEFVALESTGLDCGGPGPRRPVSRRDSLPGHRHAIPCQAVHGRTDIVKASMLGSKMSC